jgi:hypothetical protein
MGWRRNCFRYEHFFFSTANVQRVSTSGAEVAMPEEKNQQSSYLWVVLVSILGLFAINLPKQIGDNSPPAKEAKAEKQPGTKGASAASKGARDALKPLRLFLGMQYDHRDESVLVSMHARSPSGSLDLEYRSDMESGGEPVDEKLKEKLGQYHVESLIVSVLDPIDSQLAYVFDQTVEIIDLAMGECGYIRDRFWLPWDEDKQNLSDQGRILGKARKLSPGVLLFRRGPDSSKDKAVSNSKPRLCIVFLVGESPTVGINKNALRMAFRLIEDYDLYGQVKKIRIVGPACSGSEESLQSVVREWIAIKNENAMKALYATRIFAVNDISPTGVGSFYWPVDQRWAGFAHPPIWKPAFAFQRISGSATAVSRTSEPDVLEFKGTVRRAEQVGKAIRYYFEKRDKSNPADAISDEPSFKIAFLRESNTTFGKDSFGNQSTNLTGEDGPGTFLFLPFPVHISQLKQTVERERQQKEARLSLPSLSPLVPSVREAVAAKDDVYPAQDPTAAAAINGEALSNLLSTIVQERIRYVGIIASDTRDQIFLSYALRESCPGVQIFIVGSDLYQTLPDYRSFMKGTVIGSTYPMFPLNQRWTGTLNKRMAFTGDGAQGNYNAILALMENPEKMVEYRAPQLSKDKKENDYERIPPIWISVIGQDGDIIPLQYFTPKHNNKYLWNERDSTQAKKNDNHASKPTVNNQPISFSTLAILAIVGVCIGCLVFLYQVFWRGWNRLIWDSRDVPERSLTWEEFFYRTVCLLSLSALLLPVISLMGTYVQTSSKTGWENWITYAPLLVAFFLLVALVWPLCCTAYCLVMLGTKVRPEADQGKPIWRSWFGWGVLLGLLVVCFLVAGTVLIWKCFWQANLRSWDVLFFQRATAFQSGMSPLVPLFFLSIGAFSWGYYHLLRCYLRDSRKYAVDSPFSTEKNGDVPFDASFREICKCDREVRACQGVVIHYFLHVKDGWLIPCLLLAGNAGLFWYLQQYELLPTIEGPLWDETFFWGFLIGSCFVSLTLARLLITWKKISKLMGAIALVPMVRAFGTLPAKIISDFGGQLFSRRTRVTRRLLAAHQLSLLVDAMNTYKDDHASSPDKPSREDLLNVMALARDLSARLNKELEYEVSERRATPPQGGRPADAIHPNPANQAVVYSLCQQLFKLLMPFWKKRSIQDAFGMDALKGREDSNAVKADASQKTQTAENAWIELAEEFLASWTVIYLGYHFVQMRFSARSLMVGSAALLLAGSCYPFYPERLKLGLLLLLVSFVLGASFYVSVCLNKNELVSRVMGTTPNRFTLDRPFVLSQLTSVGYLAAIVIGSLGAFRFILEPILRLLM